MEELLEYSKVTLFVLPEIRRPVVQGQGATGSTYGHHSCWKLSSIIVQTIDGQLDDKSRLS